MLLERGVSREAGHDQPLARNDPAEIVDRSHRADRGIRLEPWHAGAQEETHHRVAAGNHERPLDEDAVHAEDAGARQQAERGPGPGLGLSFPFFDQLDRIGLIGRAGGFRRAVSGGRKRPQQEDRRRSQPGQPARRRGAQDHWLQVAPPPGPRNVPPTSNRTEHANGSPTFLRGPIQSPSRGASVKGPTRPVVAVWWAKGTGNSATGVGTANPLRPVRGDRGTAPMKGGSPSHRPLFPANYFDTSACLGAYW